MKLCNCSNCNNLLYFENNFCLKCNQPVGFLTDTFSMITLLAGENNHFTNIEDKNDIYHYCQNATLRTCNWLIKDDKSSG